MSDTLASPTGSSDSEDLRAILSKAWDEAEDTADEPVAEPEAETEAEKPARVRDEHGRFAKAEADPVEQPAAEPVAKTEPEPVASTALEPPVAWKAEAKAEWSKLPESVQKYLVEREAEVHRGMTRQDEERSFGRSMRDAVAPHMDALRKANVDPSLYVKNLLDIDFRLRNAPPQEKAMLVAQLAQNIGIDLNQAAQLPRSAPEVVAAEQRARAAELQLQAYQHQQREAQQAALQSQVEEFRAVNPHFDTLRPMMSGLLQTGQAQDLKTAYEMALRAHPDTQQVWVQQEIARTQGANREQERARTAAAKQAAVSVAGSPGGAVSQDAPAASLREELERNLAKLGRM